MGETGSFQKTARSQFREADNQALTISVGTSFFCTLQKTSSHTSGRRLCSARFSGRSSDVSMDRQSAVGVRRPGPAAQRRKDSAANVGRTPYEAATCTHDAHKIVPALVSLSRVRKDWIG